MTRSLLLTCYKLLPVIGRATDSSLTCPTSSRPFFRRSYIAASQSPVQQPASASPDGTVLSNATAGRTAALPSGSLLNIETEEQPVFVVPTSTDVKEAILRVKAYHWGRRIDIETLCRPNPRQQPRDYCILRYQEPGANHTSTGTVQAGSLVVVFRFGSGIVYSFDGLPDNSEAICADISQHIRHPIKQPLTEEACMVLRPAMQQWFAKEPDKICVRELNVGSLEVISRVLAQSVALDYYNGKVDQFLADFDEILAEVAGTAKSGSSGSTTSGTLGLLRGTDWWSPGGGGGLRMRLRSRLRSAELLKKLAASSMLYTEVIGKLGLLDTSKTAWKSDRYDEIWTFLRKDYEIEKRLDNLSRKLVPIQDVAKFILDVRRDQASAFAEQIIIVLIMMEIVISLVFHMS